ncbi:MAG: PDZ domain-containing protein, partial [Planctomycetota bacterium]
GTKAAVAGLKPGDILTALNGRKLKASRVQDSEMLERQVENLTIGTEAKFTVIRGADELEIPVVLEAPPRGEAEAETAKDEFLEISVRDIMFMDRISNKWDGDVKGVILGNVVIGGWAHLGGLRGKDLLVSIQDIPVPDVEAFEKVLKGVYQEKPRYIKLFIRRNYKTSYLFVEPDWTQYESGEGKEEKK